MLRLNTRPGMLTVVKGMLVKRSLSYIAAQRHKTPVSDTLRSIKVSYFSKQRGPSF